MTILLIIWLVSLIVTVYHVVILRNTRIYPPKKVLRGRALKWGIASMLFFFIWLIMLLVR